MPRALPLSLSVPVRLVKAGTMPARHWCSPAAFMLSPRPEGAGVSQQGRYELAGTVVTAETGNFQPFPSAWKKKQGQTQEQQFAASQLETAATRYAGKRKGLTRLQRYRRGSTGFCVRSWTGTGGSALLQRLGTLFAQQTFPWG